MRTLPHRAISAVLGAACLVAALFAHTAPAPAQRQQAEPEAAGTRTDRPLARAQTFMIAAANPAAAAAGREMLAEGGSAIDAAIAAQLVLGLVEPQSSGLGGGAFIVHFAARDGTVSTYDGRETAPAAASGDRFLTAGRALSFDQAVRSGLSVGVPGVPRLMEHVHRRHGRLAWQRLFAPALRLAREGFIVSPRLAGLLASERPATFGPAAQGYFFDAMGKPRRAGERLANPAYAELLAAMAASGSEAFYRGPTAAAIVQAVAAASRPGDLTLADLAGYSVIERAPICGTYRRHRVCGMGPPSSGGLAVLQALALLEAYDLGRPLDSNALHLIAEALKLAFADRNRYVADPAFVPLPGGLLDQGYIDARRLLLDPSRPRDDPQAGLPPGLTRRSHGEDSTIEAAGTSHVSIIDAEGNAVALTTTIESAFGSGLMAAGMLLNNQLTDFSFRAVDTAGNPIANRIEPGKRPRSSMAPTILFNPDGTVRAVLGSPGGSRIIGYVLKSIVGLVDWQLDAQAAAALVNFGSRGRGFEIEYDQPLQWAGLLRAPFALIDPARTWSRKPAVWQAIQLRARGHRIVPDTMTSGIHIIVRREGSLEGGADPRREGVAIGERDGASAAGEGLRR